MGFLKEVSEFLALPSKLDKVTQAVEKLSEEHKKTREALVKAGLIKAHTYSNKQ